MCRVRGGVRAKLLTGPLSLSSSFLSYRYRYYYHFYYYYYYYYYYYFNYCVYYYSFVTLGKRDGPFVYQLRKINHSTKRDLIRQKSTVQYTNLPTENYNIQSQLQMLIEYHSALSVGLPQILQEHQKR